MAIVRPETIVRGYRMRFRAFFFWRWKSCNLGGRLKINEEIRDLVCRMCKENPVCTEKSIQLETKGIQPGGLIPINLSCVILGRSVKPSWRRTPAKFAPFSGESSFRYTQDIDSTTSDGPKPLEL